jgi:hypothetical protein
MAGRQEQVRMAGSLKTLGYSELRTTDLPLQIRNQSRIKMDRPVKKNNWKFRAGIILMIVSVPPFLAIPVIPDEPQKLVSQMIEVCRSSLVS